jgi:ribonucleotide reductase beta subunit family protein with ferritin-like domain
MIIILYLSELRCKYKKELTEEEKQITKKVVDGLTNDSSEELINLMKECNISDGVIMLTMLGIGTHTEYYKVLYNRINNNKDKMNDNLLKKEVVDILHEIDRNEDE